MPYWVYLVRCKDGSLYCGVTKDLEERVKAHNAGRGGHYTRAHRPVKLAYREKKKSLREALRREREIKGFSRERKLRLVAGAIR